MNISVINELDVFELNPNMKVTLVEIGPKKNTVVIVDDFYKDPSRVRDLALKIPATRSENIMMSMPGSRVDASYDLSSMGKIFDNLIQEHFIKRTDIISNVENIFKSATFCVNIMHQRDLIPKVPHVDSTESLRFAATIYLNTPEECEGGTAFYTYNGSPYFKEIPYDVDSYVYDNIKNWELIYLAEMKYNRMVLYRQNVLHTAYISPTMFNKDVYRIAQIFFI